jgi:hypothetical protein
MKINFFTTDPAPLDVRVARVVVPPWPFAAYFLIRAPQVAEGVMVPWPEAVAVTLLAAVLVPIWLYWVADLVAWKRDRPTPAGEPSPLELTADLSDHGVFAGDLAALVDAEAHGRAVPPKHRATNYFVQAEAAARMADEHDAMLYALGARRGLDGDWIVEMPSTDDRPTEPLLLTHEFTPASGVRMDAAFADADVDWEEFGHTDEGVIMSWDPAADGQQVIARTPDGRVYPVGRVDVVKSSPTGRYRRVEPRLQAIPPIADVPNAEAYAFLNRSRELDL